MDPAPAQFTRYARLSGAGAYNAARNIVAIGTETQISVVDCATGGELKKIVLSDSHYLTALTMLEDGRTLVGGLEEGLIRIWDI